MVVTRSVPIRRHDVVALVGTTKGAFLLRSNPARSRWELGGPFFPGQQIYSVALDPRGGRTRMFAAGGSDHFGPVFYWSDDFGATWTNPERMPVRFPEDAGASVKRIWQIRQGPGEVLYCGVEPAALFESRDGGESWSLVRGLWDHPHRPQWQPGGGGLCLHTILPDPRNAKRLTVAISTGGVYRTDDGGRTWQARNQGVRAQFLPDKYPEFGQCVHKVVHHPSRPERLFLQNHWGLYRSDDAGDSWQDIANGVPSDFGFAMAMHPHDAETVYIVPIESDMFRCTPEGRLRVYRTRNAGMSWEPLAKGLPQKNALETILRDAMDVDSLNPAGVYFGTRSGSVWGSPDGGANWSEIQGGLPPVTCLKVAVIGGAAGIRTPRASARRATRPAQRRAAHRPARAVAAKKKAVASRGARARASRAPARKRGPRRRG